MKSRYCDNVILIRVEVEFTLSAMVLWLHGFIVLLLRGLVDYQQLAMKP